MNKVDPDIIAALRTIAASGSDERVVKTRKRHEEQLKERMNTFVELLSDELEEVIPRSSPLFLPVLMMVVMKKVAAQVPHERESFLDEGFPAGW